MFCVDDFTCFLRPPTLPLSTVQLQAVPPSCFVPAVVTPLATPEWTLWCSLPTAVRTQPVLSPFQLQETAVLPLQKQGKHKYY